MKKLILLSLISSFAFCGSVTRAEDSWKEIQERQKKEIEELQKKINSYKQYSIGGKIFNYTKYNSHIRVTIEDEELGRITLRIEPNFKIEKKKELHGSCFKYDFGEYQNCYIY